MTIPEALPENAMEDEAFLKNLHHVLNNVRTAPLLHSIDLSHAYFVCLVGAYSGGSIDLSQLQQIVSRLSGHSQHAPH
jgi:hypothetical protein